MSGIHNVPENVRDPISQKALWALLEINKNHVFEESGYVALCDVPEVDSYSYVPKTGFTLRLSYLSPEAVSLILDVLNRHELRGTDRP